MNLIVNGIEHEIVSPPLTPLLPVLREELDITGPKAGCQQGGCGTCTVLVDGEPRRSCLTAVAAVDGANDHHDRRARRGRGAVGRPAGVLRPLRRAVRLLHARDGHRLRRR